MSEIKPCSEITQADRNRADAEVCRVFVMTRHACLLKIERAKDLVGLTSMARKYPDIAESLNDFLDALSVMTAEVLLDPSEIETTAQAFARHRADACATVQKERDEAREIIRAIVEWPSSSPYLRVSPYKEAVAFLTRMESKA